MDKLVITRLQGKICTASVSDRKVTGITLEEEDKASILKPGCGKNKSTGAYC